MKKDNLLANMAGKVLAFAAAMMMSVAFTACSGNDDDTQEPQPEPSFTNTVTVDGKTMPVLLAEYGENKDGLFEINLILDKARKTTAGFVCSSDIVGKDIDLTQKVVKNIWLFAAIMEDGTSFSAFPIVNQPTTLPSFTTGTLRIDNYPDGEMSVSLKNGKIIGTEASDKPHTISISWKGTPMEKKN